MIQCGTCGCALTPSYTTRHGRRYGYYICSKANKDPHHNCPLRRIPCTELEKLVLKQVSGIFKTPSILRATLAAVREREINLRKNYEQDIERLTQRLTELKKELLGENGDFEAVKHVAEMLTETRRKLKALSKPVSEDEVITALNDVDGPWEFMFPGTKSELLRLVLGKIIVFPEQISFTGKIRGADGPIKDWILSNFCVAGYEQFVKLLRSMMLSLANCKEK